MDRQGRLIQSGDILKYVLVCFAAVVLSVALKNYLVYATYDTALCRFLCVSLFGEADDAPPSVVGRLFALQTSLEEMAQHLFSGIWRDPTHLFTGLVAAPLLEETIYRGPLFLLKRYAASYGWWVAAAVLSTLFALSHGRTGLALLPLLMLGLGCSWLIARTQRFWPSIAAHALFNFFFCSVALYQSLFWGD